MRCLYHLSCCESALERTHKEEEKEASRFVNLVDHIAEIQRFSKGTPSSVLSGFNPFIMPRSSGAYIPTFPGWGTRFHPNLVVRLRLP